MGDSLTATRKVIQDDQRELQLSSPPSSRPGRIGAWSEALFMCVQGKHEDLMIWRPEFLAVVLGKIDSTLVVPDRTRLSRLVIG